MPEPTTTTAGGRTQTKEKQPCPQCGGLLYYYDGALGYEALKCRGCDYELDLNAAANARATAEREHQAAINRMVVNKLTNSVLDAWKAGLK